MEAPGFDSVTRFAIRSARKTGLALCLLLLFCTPARPAPPDTGSRLHRVELEHFTLWSQRELSQSDIYETRQNLQNVRRDVGRAFGGYFPRRKFDVVLTEEDVFHAYSGSPKHVAGLFDGTIHLPVMRRDAPARLKAILYHEYTHALVWLASEGRCPSWIHEGLAVDQEEGVDPHWTLDAGTLVKDGRLLWPLDQLDAHLVPDAADPQSNERGYQEAFAVVRFLRSQATPAELLRWLRRMGREMRWDAAAKETLGLDAAGIERGTVEKLTKG